MKKKIAISFLGILIIILVLEFGLRIPCLFHELTGLYCPGCGATRSIVSLIKLNPYQAFRYNMIITILIPIFLIWLFYKYILKGKKRIPNWMWWTLLVVLLVFGVLRNIPFFDFLAPTEIIN